MSDWSLQSDKSGGAEYMLLATTKRLRQQFATEGSESDWSLSAWSVFSPHVSTANRENCPREKKRGGTGSVLDAWKKERRPHRRATGRQKHIINTETLPDSD